MTVPAILETHMAIVGTTGAGKTVTGKGYVEQLLGDGRQVVVIDPTGAWWGMQANAAGDGPGLRIPVFGGLHANAPIEADDGARVAELLIEQRVSAIVDLSEMDEEEQRLFALGFIARMRTKPIGNLHLVIDEADELAPELVPDSAAFQLKRALAWIAKRGRIRGFVLTIITQRPADIAKSVLALAQTMVIHRLIAPQDQAPIDRYLKSHGTAATRKEVLASLAGLKRGERWIYSPVEDVLERGTSPALTTFDSSAAPIAGQAATEPQALADVDFAALAEALAAGRPAPDKIAEVEARDPGAWEALVARVDALEAARAAAFDKIPADADLPAGVEHPAPVVEPIAPRADVDEALAAMRSPRGYRVRVGGPPSPMADAPGAVRGRKALAVLARIHPAGLTEPQWATLAGYTRSGGTWKTYRADLARAGLIEQVGERWGATSAGLTAAGVSSAPLPPPGPALARFWSERVPGAPRLVEVLVKRWPHAVTAESLASDVGMTASGGTFKTYLGRLRSNGLLEERGRRVRLAPAIMGQQPT